MRSTFAARQRSATVDRSAASVLLLGLMMTAAVAAQGRATQAPASSARADAPIDLTGYWVSVVTQEWRWRMVTQAKGDYASISITIEDKTGGERWAQERESA